MAVHLSLSGLNFECSDVHYRIAVMIFLLVEHLIVVVSLLFSAFPYL